VLRKFINDFRRHAIFVPDSNLIERHSRTLGAHQLAELFEEVAREAVNA
jgi:hypothetical protein